MRFIFRTTPFVAAIVLLSLVMSAATAAELQLAGIRLGRSALTVIQKYGNPTDVRVGAAAHTQAGTPGAPAAPAMPGMPMEAPPGGLPGMPAAPMEAPPTGMPAAPGMPDMMANPFGQTQQRQGPPEITWVYKFPKNKTLEFIISPDGRVVQISAFGVEWPGVATSKGIRLGQTYKDVIMAYGFPESHARSGVELLARYPEKHRAVFTFVGKSLVGITIALMD